MIDFLCVWDPSCVNVAGFRFEKRKLLHFVSSHNLQQLSTCRRFFSIVGIQMLLNGM